MNGVLIYLFGLAGGVVSLVFSLVAALATLSPPLPFTRHATYERLNTLFHRHISTLGTYVVHTSLSSFTFSLSLLLVVAISLFGFFIAPPSPPALALRFEGGRKE